MNRRPRTKAEKLRIAARVCWLMGTFLTARFIYSVMSMQTESMLLALLITVVASAGLQYVLSLTESALIDGSLPSPWSEDWSWQGSLPWLFAAAILCLLIDAGLNLAGIAVFTSAIKSSDLAAQQLQLQDSFVVFVSRAATILLALLFALGPELLDEFAHWTETGQSRAAPAQSNRHQTFKQSQSVKQQTDRHQVFGQSRVAPAQSNRQESVQHQVRSAPMKTKNFRFNDTDQDDSLHFDS